MKSFCLVFLSLLLSVAAMGQQTERPSWVDGDGLPINLNNSTVKRFYAESSTREMAKELALQSVVEEQSRATGQRYVVRSDNGSTVITGQDELTVTSTIRDEYVEQLPTGAWRVNLLVQTAKNPEYALEPVSVTSKYPFSARVFVPGMAQLHKGSTGKGIFFIAAEIVAVGGIVACEGLRSSYDSKINSTHNAKDRQNYINDRDNMQNLRNGFIAGAAAIYLWNVIDGIVAKGKKHIEVGNLAMSINPYGTPREAGVLLSVNF